MNEFLSVSATYAGVIKLACMREVSNQETVLLINDCLVEKFEEISLKTLSTKELVRLYQIFNFSSTVQKRIEEHLEETLKMITDLVILVDEWSFLRRVDNLRLIAESQIKSVSDGTRSVVELFDQWERVDSSSFPGITFHNRIIEIIRDYPRGKNLSHYRGLFSLYPRDFSDLIEICDPRRLSVS